MDSFLAQVARALYDKYGDDISSLNVIFPSRRARLFFTDELSRIASRPLWQPRWTSIGEVAEEIAGVRSGDRARLITELYKVYSRHHDEPFDAFYFWGEMLLADFDTVDKYLLDADVLFSNVADLKLLDADTSYLDDEQRRVVARFWSSFGERADYSEQQKRFIEIWTTLASVYHEFRAALTAQGLAYSGMAYRAAAEKIASGEFPKRPPQRYVVAGFNALTECEKVIFDHLSREHEVDFFWDWDHYYVDNNAQEAGLFLRENLRRYPPKTPLKDKFDNFSRPKNITVASAPSDSLQCRYVTEFLRGIERPGKETAIVLTDENLLLPVLHAIPPEVDAVNVTMGYPLKLTLEYSFTEQLIMLRTRRRERGGRVLFHHEDVSALLSHPFVGARTAAFRQVYVAPPEGLTGLAAEIFEPVESGWKPLAEYLKNIVLQVDGKRDFLNIIVENIDKLANSLSNCGVELTAATFASLLRRVLQSERIPYEGEPLRGVQVMGILETRNLDFENVLLLSATDDTFPGVRISAPSFIPHNLRLAYGLPTPAHHEGVYAYYFYRLLQRAGNIHIGYSMHADQRSSGEQSRYIYQLEYESPHRDRIVRRELSVDVSVEPQQSISITKTPEMLGRTLSPTSFFNYVQCPLKFYFRTVAGLRAPEEVTDEVGAPMFGTILHKAMELYYRGEGDPETVVDRAIDLECGSAERPGALLLARDIVVKYLTASILLFDKRQRAVIDELEKPLSTTIGGVKFAGIADRIDRLPDGRARIVDYKTGAPNLEFKGLDALFSPDMRDQNPAALQILLYAMMFAHTTGRDVQPALYYVRTMRAPDYSPLLFDRSVGGAVDSYFDCRDRFEALLKEKLDELTDLARPFSQCEDPAPCTICDYNVICKR